MNVLKSKTIQLRLVEESDADFILGLRLNNEYNKYLSRVSGDINSQKKWISEYKKDEVEKRQFYFIIEKINLIPCGTVRIYDLREDSFSWGSWILGENKTKSAAIESAFLVYDFGFNFLSCKKSHFSVMKGNEGVISFHTKMGARKVDEDADSFFFEITKEAVEESKNKFLRKIK